MALEIIEGFSIYRDVADLTLRFPVTLDTSLVSVLPTGGQMSTGAIEFGGDPTQKARVKLAMASTQTKKFGFWFNPVSMNALSPGYETFLAIENSTDTVLGSLRILADGTLQFRGEENGAVLIDSSLLTRPRKLAFNTAVMIELRVHLASASAGQVDLYVSGTKWASIVNFNTGATVFTTLSFHSGLFGNGLNYQVSDLYVMNADTDVLMGGVWQVRRMTPTSDTTKADFTPLGGGTRFSEIDEATPTDGDASYNSSNTAGHEDRFNPSDIVLNWTRCPGLICKMQARETDVNANMRFTIFNVVKASSPDVSVLFQATYRPYWSTPFIEHPDLLRPFFKADLTLTDYGYEVMA